MWQKIKNNEIIMYLIFGVLTTVVNIVSFQIFLFLHCPIMISNVIAWILSVLFAFVTNAKYVFQKTYTSRKEQIKEFASFTSSRIVTLVLEMIILGIGLWFLPSATLLVKIIAQVLVIILNYLLSKFIVFNKKSRE